MTPIQQAIAILEEDALTNRIERALEVLRGVPQSPTSALEQIAIVCTDNMDRSCDHRMALDFVRQIANDALANTRPNLNSGS